MRHRGRRGEPNGPEESEQSGRAGRAGGTGTGRAGWAGNTETSLTGRNRKSPERKTAPGLIVTDRRGYNNPSDRGRTPGASPNHRTHPSSTGRILAPRPRASGSSRVHPAPPNTTLLNCRTAKPPNCQTAEHRRVRRRSPLALVARGRGTGVLLEVLAEEGLR